MEKRSQKRWFLCGLVTLIIFCSLIFGYFKANKSIFLKENLSTAAQKIVKSCSNTILWQKCYSEKMVEFNQHQPFPRTIELMDTIQFFDTKTNNCHLMAHKIIASEIAKDPTNWMVSLQYVGNPYKCSGGFVHGAFEGKKRYDSSLQLDTETITSICSELSQKIQQSDLIQCGHAVGHVLLVEVNGDVKRGANICNSLPLELAKGCNDGIFMENITRLNLVDHNISKKPEITESFAKEIQTLCNSFPFMGVSNNACWWEISQIYYGLAGPNMLEIKKYCERANSEHNKMNCYLHSFDFALVDPKFDDQQFTTMCIGKDMNYDNQKACYGWVLSSLLAASKNYKPRADYFCKVAPDNFRNECEQLKLYRLRKYE